MAGLYSNETFRAPVVAGLRTLGHDVLTSLEAGNAGQSIPDDAVLAFATAHGRALLTLNRRHFIRLHTAGVARADVIACTFDPDFAAQAGRIDAAIRAIPNLAGQVVRVNRPP